MAMLQLLLLVPLLAVAVSAVPRSAPVVVRTGGLSIAFDADTAAPVSVKNTAGLELLEPGVPQPGFTIVPGSGAHVRFDTVREIAPNQLLFGVAATGEQLGWAFGGAGHYVTANCTGTRGFERWTQASTPRSVHFGLVGDGLRGIALNYMVWDSGNSGRDPLAGVNLIYEAPWVAPNTVYSTWNPPARFGVYEIGDPATEDETLIDLWVDEGLPHPRVSGPWDRPTARAWLAAWINATSDISNFAMVPKNLSEWRKFIPLAKKADAKVLWFNYRSWDYTSIDNVNPAMFPNGLADFKRFSEDAAAQGLRLSTHRMSGGLDPRDPDYCAKPSPGLLAWGNMTLSAPASAAANGSIVVTPAPGTTLSDMPAYMHGQGGTCSLGGIEYVQFSSIVPLPSGDWTMHLTRSASQGFPAGAVVRCYVKGHVYFLPDAMSDLYEEVAVRYANFSNLVGFQDGSFDGAAWFAWYGRWAFYKFATLVYENLDHPTAVHTSGVIVAPGWPEYRFNAVRAAFGGSFTTQPAGAPLTLTAAGHPQPGLEEVANNLFKGLAGNSRQFSIGQDLFSSLEAYEQVGNADAIFELVREYKRGSLAMDAAQRQFMAAAAWFKDPRRHVKNVARARWMAEGDVYRKWTNAGTSVYDTLSFPASSYVPSRFYVRGGVSEPLVLPPDLQSGVERHAVVGRVLPSFDAASPKNIDLLSKMQAGSTLQLCGSNPSANETWNETRLKAYTVAPLDLTHHQGIGMFVDGDGSGGTLVVRLTSGNVARDYAVPLTFTGRQWIEVPAGEQGWSARNWGPTGKGAVVWVQMNYESITEVAVGVGYLPAHTSSKVDITGLQALSEVEAPLVDPVITVGDQTVLAKGTLSMYDQFTLDPDGTFTIYDPTWRFVSNCSVGAFHPTNLTSFKMSAAAAADDAAITSPAWLEVGVSGSTTTVPNPGHP